jgi:hypothetical protein
MSSVTCNQIFLRLICGRSPTKLLKKILPKRKTHRWRTTTMPDRKEEGEEVEEVTGDIHHPDQEEQQHKNSN